MAVTNLQAYSAAVPIVTVKSFIVYAPRKRENLQKNVKIKICKEDWIGPVIQLYIVEY
jgi:hypothetical protein